MSEQTTAQPELSHSSESTGNGSSFVGSRWLGVARAPDTLLAAQSRFRDAVYRRSLAISDAVAALLALAITVAVAANAHLSWHILLTLPVVVLFGKLRGLYDRDTLVLRRSTLDEVPHLFELATLFTLATWLLDGWIVRGASLDRPVVLLLWGALFALAIVGRVTTRALVRRLVSAERCMVIGGREVSAKLETVLAHRAGLEVVSRFPMRGRDGGRYEPLNVAVAAARNRIRFAVEKFQVHRVVLAVNDSNDEGILDAIFVLEELGLKVSVVPHMLEVVGSAGEFEDVEGTPILGIGNFGLSRSSLVIKRALDLALGSVAMILALPLLACIVAVVKLSSSGPVFFRQRRVGRDGKQFEMFKFRTMYDGTHALRTELAELNETSGLFKIGNDPRVTPVGRILRASSLDELPQLFNVMRGEMSLVGPRPLIPEEDDKVLGWARRRLHLTPGMTGPWQVLGQTRVPLEEMVKIDYLYIANWSLWADIKALLRTLPHVLARRGL